MKFASKFENGTFLKRYKRFFADIEWKGQIVTAHVANTGSLRSCLSPGQACRFSVSNDPSRKLKYSLEMLQAPSGAWVGINTSLPNKLVKEALEEKLLPQWKNFVSVKAEAKLDAKTRFDFEAKDSHGQTYYLEVKNVTLVEEGRAQFPDAVTERGQKHLRELTRLKQEGFEAELIFTVQRNDAQVFSPADHIDPEYGKLLRAAHKAGVRITVLPVKLTDSEATLEAHQIPLRL